MTFDEWLTQLWEEWDGSERWGQTLFGELWMIKSNLCRDAIEQKLDPFYVDSEHPMVYRFLRYVDQHWND